jgi:DnaJ homolog subfamily A member 2
MEKDPQGFYEVLGLKPGASIDEVRRAYNAQQRKYHPDGAHIKEALRKCKTDAEREKVKEEYKRISSKCNQAKSVLYDANKKKEYDSGMPSDFAGFSGAAGAADFFDIFSQFTGGSRRNQVQKVKDIEYEFQVTFKEAFLGKVASFNVKVQRECTKCDCKGGDQLEACSTCKGKGKIEYHKRLGPYISVSEDICNVCDGFGKVVKGKVCTDCNGKRYKEVKEHVEVNVEPGVMNGKTYKFVGRGNHKKGCVPGDIILVVNIAKDPRFRRNGYNLISKADIPLYTALTGGPIYFDHINGKKLEIMLKPFTDFKKCIFVKGEGYKLPTSNQCGDLIIDPNIVIDRNIDKNTLARALNYSPTKNVYTGNCQQKVSEFGRMPEEKAENEEKHFGHGSAEDFMGGNASSFFSKFGFF